VAKNTVADVNYMIRSRKNGSCADIPDAVSVRCRSYNDRYIYLYRRMVKKRPTQRAGIHVQKATC